MAWVGVVLRLYSQHSGARGRTVSAGLRPAWFTKGDPGQLGLRGETPSQNKRRKKIKGGWGGAFEVPPLAEVLKAVGGYWGGIFLWEGW